VAGNSDGDTDGSAADAAPVTLSHMTKATVARDRMVRLLSRKSCDR
jgi:hypothetical protein